MAKRPAEARSYHHGDLRSALLKAASEELAEKGVEGFTLRSCARRAGVSHAAPAHHFGDVTGLLTEVATDAFHRLTKSMRDELERAGPAPIDAPIAIALGYALFGIRYPAEFRLMFRTERLDPLRPGFRKAGSEASGLAAGAVGSFYRSAAPMSDPIMIRRVIAFWSLAHGLASLAVAEQLGPIAGGEKVARTLVPDLVREHFGLAAVNDPRDLKFIARTSEAQRA
jgi:AcrR family transcriptional regulator